MKVLLLGPASSIHTLRWANGLFANGVELVVVTQHHRIAGFDPKIKIIDMPNTGFLGYFRNAKYLRGIIETEKPDIMNVHYASGYGTTARMSKYAPTMLSVWGSDVFKFPHISRVHMWHIRKNLRYPTRIAATSLILADNVSLVCPIEKSIFHTPFGVDTDLFHRMQASKDNHKSIVIGTVKTLSYTYGIDILIKAFALLLRNLEVSHVELHSQVRLCVVGGGPDRVEFEKLVCSLGIQRYVEFVGAVPHDQIPAYLSQFDIYAALSREESFGVAVIEASACECPVVVSRTGGLPEVVEDQVTGLIVSPFDHVAASEALQKLVLDSSLRHKMGKAGRQFVVKNYEWRDSVRRMISAYRSTIKDHMLATVKK